MVRFKIFLEKFDFKQASFTSLPLIFIIAAFQIDYGFKSLFFKRQSTISSQKIHDFLFCPFITDIAILNTYVVGTFFLSKLKWDCLDSQK